MVLTELRPSFTVVRTASPFATDLEGSPNCSPARMPAADVDDVVQLFEAHGAVDAQVRAGAWRRAFERDVDADGAVRRRRIDPRDLAFDDAIAGIDFGVLPILMSLVCVSAMRSSAFSTLGFATRADCCPG